MIVNDWRKSPAHHSGRSGAHSNVGYTSSLVVQPRAATAIDAPSAASSSRIDRQPKATTHHEPCAAAVAAVPLPASGAGAARSHRGAR